MARQTRAQRRARREQMSPGSEAALPGGPPAPPRRPTARASARPEPAREPRAARGGTVRSFVAESWAELKKVQTEKRVLPGYVLVNMDMTDEAWTVVKNTPGVTGFVGAGAKPVPLAQQEVDRILHTGRGDGERPRAQVEFSLGESVKVTSGPLSDFDGEVVDVNADQQKLKVLVDIFERQVPVELTFDQVKKID